MKEFFFIDHYPFRSGGMETHAREYIHHNTHRIGKNFFVIGFSFEQEKDIKKKDEILVLHRNAIKRPYLVLKILTKYKITPGDVMFFNSLYWIEIMEELKKFFPDTIFILRSGGNDIIQSPVLNLSGTLKQRRKYVVSTLNKSLDVLIANSEFTKKRFLHAGINSSIIEVIIGGVDIKKFKKIKDTKQKKQMRRRLGISENSLIFLSVCRLVRFKGVSYLLRAIKPILKENNVELVIIGDGPLRDSLKKYTERNKISDKVKFIGEVSFYEISNYYKTADVYIQSSIQALMKVPGGSYIHTETMGRSLCEARASGLPIIATNVGGVSEVVFPHNGTLVRQKNIIGMRNEILKYVSKDSRKVHEIYSVDESKLSWNFIFSHYKDIIKILRNKRKI